MVVFDLLKKISGNSVLEQMETKDDFDREEFIDMLYGVLEVFAEREMNISERDVAKIIDMVISSYGSQWGIDSIRSVIEEYNQDTGEFDLEAQHERDE